MKKSAVFGIVLVNVFVLSLFVTQPDVLFPLFPSAQKTHSDIPHVSDPLSLAILAPTVTPTPLAPPATAELHASESDATYPILTAGNTAVEAATRASKSDSDVIVLDTAEMDATAPDAGAADALTAESADDAALAETDVQTNAPLLAPVVLPTPTSDASLDPTEARHETHNHDDATAVAANTAPANTELANHEDIPAETLSETAAPVAEPVPVQAEIPAPLGDVRPNTSIHACQVSAPPEGFNPYYAKYCAASGVPILASAGVSDLALEHAWATITYILDGIAHAGEIRATMAGLGFRMGIIGVDHAPTDLPEHSNLYTLFPGVDWNARTRAIGATSNIPLMSVSEENLLCLPQDQWRGQNLLVHEFAHAIKNLGLDYVNPGVHTSLVQAYQQAQAGGLWANTYVISDVEEYWAEGVRLYFQHEPGGGTPGGQPYPANTRAELQSYDPELYGIIESIFGQKSALPACP